MGEKLIEITSEDFEKLLEKNNSDNLFSDVNIENYEVKGNIIIRDSGKKINISNCKINGELFLSGKNNSLYIYNLDVNSIFIDKINSFCILSGNIGAIILSKNTEINFLSIGNPTKNGVTFIGFFMFGGAKIDRGYFYNTIILDLKINGCELDKLIFGENLFIEKYSLSGNHLNNCITHEGLVFSDLDINNFIGGPRISFINCKNGIEPNFKDGKKRLNEILDDYYINSNKKLKEENIGSDDIKISVSKHKIEKKDINIKKSNLDKTQFHNCNFKDSNIKIENSNISEIVTTNFNLPENIKSNSLEGQRENYRQLKYNFSKQGDSYNALNNYNKELTILLKESFKKFNIGDLFVLGLGKVISGNGTNWLLSLFWIILLNFILFCYFLYSSGINIELNLDIDFSFLLYNLKYSYFLSNIDSLKILGDFSTNSELVFYFTKILNAVLFYHLIISFRKFNKTF